MNRVLGACLLATAIPIASVAAPTIGGCPVFPANHYWNTRIDHLPVHSLSATWMANYSGTTRQDFGTTELEYGIPYSVVPQGQTAVPINYGVCNTGGGGCENYSTESDPGPYPIPPNAPIEGGNVAVPDPDVGDTHTLTIRQVECFLYETYRSRRIGGGTSWTVASSAKYDLNGFALRPHTWTSADAAGYPIFPGLIRWEEANAGEVTHATRMTVPSVYGSITVSLPRGYMWPARHRGPSTNANLPPYGARFRLKASYDVEASGFTPQVKAVLRGWQRYGLVLADQGSSWYFSGVSNPNWTGTMFTQMRVPVTNFEAVDTSLLMINEESAQAVQPGAAPHDFSRDGRSDVLLKSATGELALWSMNGTAIANSTYLLGPSTGYSPAKTGDFDGDLDADILLTTTGGSVVMWQMNGSAVSGSTLLLGNGSGYAPVQVADFNGDGRDDILLRNSTDGTLAVWLMNGPTVTSSAIVLGAGTGYTPVATGDFNGDGRDDILLAHTDGTVVQWLMNGTAITTSTTLVGAGSGFTPEKIADLNGDGRDDILLRHTDGTLVAWLMNGATISSSTLLLGGGTGYAPTHVGDFNADNRDDILFKGPNGEIVVWLMNGSTITSATLLVGATTWLVSHVGDYNGDGRADLLLKNTNGSIVNWIMNGAAISSATLLSGASPWSATP